MLPRFPTEILASILLYLDPTDLQSARLLCNRVSQVIFPIFLKCCFTKIKTNFSKSSIERLEAIALFKEYQNAILELEISGPWALRFGKGLGWPRDSTGMLQEGPNVQRIRKLLTIAFPNCTKLCIVADEARRWPDYWQSEEYLTLADVIGQVFITIASPPHKLTSLALKLVPRSPEYCLEAVSPSTYKSDLFWTAWTKLKTLRLDMEADFKNRGLQLALSLITRANSLEKLALESCLYEIEPGVTPFYDLLITTDIMPKLSRLVIRDATFSSSESLVVLLKRFHAALELLSLSNVRLRGDWRDVCRLMKQQFPKLRCILLEWPGSANGDENYLKQLMCPLRTMVPDDIKRDFSFIEFHSRHLTRRYCVSGVRYSGPNVDSALELIQKSIYLEDSPLEGLEEYIPTPNPNRSRITRFNDPETEF